MKNIELHGDQFKCLFSKEEIDDKITEIARQIMADVSDFNNPPILLFVLNGGLYFGVDISRALEKFGLSCEVDTIGLKSYDSDENGGIVKITSFPRSNLANRDIIVIEDIIERGDTLNFLNQYLKDLNGPPRTVKYCALLIKKGHSSLEFNLNYLAWTVGPEWVVGYGMDSNKLGRSLTDIYKKSPI